MMPNGGYENEQYSRPALRRPVFFLSALCL